ncbi:unnamed protein product [Anisakis simplex]|uniref:DUF1360 domain-containing protein n=1 Tax=Anisakis simplex TaxID=6269 RepID=A0A0M3J3W8_ANISI|nr:unnamed protein product [Anisakis simplex]
MMNAEVELDEKNSKILLTTKTVKFSYTWLGLHKGVHVRRLLSTHFSGRWQSYAHTVAYCGMCTFQTLIYMSTMCWLAYSAYALDTNAQLYDQVHHNAADAVLLLTTGEALSMMGTVLTGVLGLVGCCRGFGRLLHALENMIAERQRSLEAVGIPAGLRRREYGV